MRKPAALSFAFMALLDATMASPPPSPSPVHTVSMPLTPPPSPKGHTFTVRQEHNDYATFDGGWELKKAYLKHDIPLPRSLRKRKAQDVPRPVYVPPPNVQVTPPQQSSPSDDGIPLGMEGAMQLTADIIALSESNDLAYLSPVVVGDNVMKLNIDTGSSNLWVFSDRLPADMQSNHALYVTNPYSTSNTSNGFIGNPGSTKQQSQSTGRELQDHSWTIRYGDGSGASGDVFLDKVSIGPITASQQAIGVARQMSKSFHDQRSDGLMGLGFGTANTIKPNKQRTFFENIRNSLAAPLFTVSLKRNETGEYEFGYINRDKYQGELQWAKVDPGRGYWEYQATGFQVGDAGQPTAMQFPAIADTGTTLLLLPSRLVSMYYEAVPNSQFVQSEGGYVYPCGTALPPLTLTVEADIQLRIPAIYLDRGLSATGSGKCYGGVQRGRDDLSIWGDVFLKSQFVVFEGGDQPRIGFAKPSIQVVNRLGMSKELLG